MTYLELWNKLGKLSDQQLACDVTVEDETDNECFPATSLNIVDSETVFDNDVLDADHPVICIKSGSNLLLL